MIVDKGGGIAILVKEGLSCHLLDLPNVHFRPISLLPVLAEVFEFFVADWLHDILTPVLDPSQFGNIKGRSTAHALVSVLHSWCQTLDRKCCVSSVFVDFSKAFDRVDRNIILAKLLHKGVPHRLVRWFYLYLLARCQCVRVDSQYSDWLCLADGMPQGSVLGALSFLLLIDDLSLQCLIHKYVDDTNLTELLIND